MEDDIYNLFLTSEQGVSLFGTLRIRRPQAVVSGANLRLPPLAPVATDALVPATQEITPILVTGSISVPVLSLFRQIPLRGTVYATAAGLFTIVLDSGNARPAIGLQLIPYGGEDLGGFVVWGTSNFSELVFSALGRQLPTGA